GIFAYERFGGDAGDAYALVVINANPNKESSTQFMGNQMTLLNVPQGTVFVDVLSAEGTKYTMTGDKLLVTLPKLSGAILIPETQL
ncbi:MAG TPA: alpha-amylase, partial [Polyangiaceae bacterium]|nr:alpha-amylase [Polyangiaceae bacterium]